MDVGPEEVTQPEVKVSSEAVVGAERSAVVDGEGATQVGVTNPLDRMA